MIKSLLLFYAFVISFSFSSCKKNYTCDCNTNSTLKTSNGDFVSIISPGSKTPYTEKMSKKQAIEACKHEQTSIQTNFTNGITGNGNSSLVAGESIVTSCNIIL
ncbi:MAG: hypothetical protein H0U95_14200 [Bacteroidetes bacterium]|nr:hypothetical protein [Bacteroidota bacterium]